MNHKEPHNNTNVDRKSLKIPKW